MTEGRERRWWCRCLQGRELLRWRGGDTVDGDDDGKEEGSSRKATSSTQQRPSTSEPTASSTEMGEAAQQGNIRWWWCWSSIVTGEGIHGNREDTNWGGGFRQSAASRCCRPSLNGCPVNERQQQHSYRDSYAATTSKQRPKRQAEKERKTQMFMGVANQKGRRRKGDSDDDDG